MVDNEDIKGILGYVTEPVRNEVVAVGVTSVMVSQQRIGLQPRKFYWIRNTSTLATQIITINLGNNPAVAGTGIVLNQNESFMDSTGEGYQCFQGIITGISAVAGGQIAMVER